MIHYFKCSNFFSIKDEVALDFRSSLPKAKGDGFVKSKALENTYLSKVIAIFGPNASGKTNVLRVLSFVSWLLAQSFSRKPDDYLPYIMYLGNEEEGSPTTRIEVVFEINEELYKYTVELIGASYIAHEQIAEFNKKTNQFNLLYKRSKSNKESSYETSDNGFLIKVPDEAINRDNSSFLSIAAQYGHVKSKSIITYWESTLISSNIDVLDGYTEESNSVREIYEASKCLLENQDIKNVLTDILNKMDIGIFDIEIKENKHKHRVEGLPQEKEITTYSTVFHRKSKTSTNQVKIPVFFESTGVKSLLFHLTKVLTRLKSDVSSVVILDEIDSGIHPELLPFFLDLFRSEKMNQHNHQLLITLHSNQLMDELEKNQIYLTDIKNLKTELYPLESIKNVRKDVSFSAAYRAGRFGAIPHLE